MNDLTKARYFLKTRNSDLQHLTTFGLMFATAESNYREIKIRGQGNKEGAGSLASKEVEAAVDYACLRYLKRFNRLPQDAPVVFSQGVTLDDKQRCAENWINACRG